jgi:hypothetical protein
MRYPSTICPVGVFERLTALAAMKHVNAVMAEKTNPKRKLCWGHTALGDAFPENYAKTSANIFPAPTGSPGEQYRILEGKLDLYDGVMLTLFSTLRIAAICRGAPSRKG